MHGRGATKNAHHEGTTGTSATLCPLAQSGCLFVEFLSVPHMQTYLEGNNVLVALMHTVRATSVPKELRKAAKAELISELIFANAWEGFSLVLCQSRWPHLHLIEWDAQTYYCTSDCMFLLLSLSICICVSTAFRHPCFHAEQLQSPQYCSVCCSGSGRALQSSRGDWTIFWRSKVKFKKPCLPFISFMKPKVMRQMLPLSRWTAPAKFRTCLRRSLEDWLWCLQRTWMMRMMRMMRP